MSGEEPDFHARATSSPGCAVGDAGLARASADSVCFLASPMFPMKIFHVEAGIAASQDHVARLEVMAVAVGADNTRWTAALPGREDGRSQNDDGKNQPDPAELPLLHSLSPTGRRVRVATLHNNPETRRQFQPSDPRTGIRADRPRLRSRARLLETGVVEVRHGCYLLPKDERSSR